MPGNLSRAKRIILSLAPFPAPIYFLVWMKPDRTPAAMAPVILAMLVYCALIILLAYRRGERPGYFDWAIAGFFAAVGVFLFAPAAALLIGRHAPTGFYLCLFAAAFLPPLGGMEPFTSQFAKKTTPPDRWDNPVFIRINLIMTYVWADIFALGPSSAFSRPIS